ncbi:MAG: Nitrogenase [Bryobacterales bacterium]|nr:Nitrogenase [Bryobacterales bacterium]
MNPGVTVFRQRVASGITSGLPAPAKSSGASEELSALAEICQLFSLARGARATRDAMENALQTLAQCFGILRGAIVTADASDQIRIEASYCDREASASLRELRGDKIVRRVLDSATAVSIAESGTVRKGVPLLRGEECFGVLAVEYVIPDDCRAPDIDGVLRVLGTLIAQFLTVREHDGGRRPPKTQDDASPAFANLVGDSAPMRELYEQIDQVSRSNATVLIRGESGTGKELIAQAIHDRSNRARYPLITVNCAAMPESLMESELYGYERGAFTGAHGRKKGRFELAEGGTLFLDEIGELNLSAQVKLLRALQDRTIERLGGTQTIKVDTRVITATNKNLEAALADQTFRDDLYYRLNVFMIVVPPLRDRKADVVPLAEYFLKRYSSEYGKNVEGLSRSAIDALMGYQWPGNVRELQNAMERAVLVCKNDNVELHHLPLGVRGSNESSGGMEPAAAQPVSLGEAAGRFEKRLIVDALKVTRGCKAESARLLRTTERILAYKIGKLAIKCDEFKNPSQHQ